MRRAVTALAVVLAGCQAVENRFVYRPTHTPEPPADPAGIRLSAAADNRRAVPLDLALADGIRVRAWCPRPGARGAVLYCHGNAGDLTDRIDPVATVLGELDESVLVFGYPGFGRSGGRPSEPGCYAAADAGYDWPVANACPADRITVVGVSLGGGVAVDLAARRPGRSCW